MTGASGMAWFWRFAAMLLALVLLPVPAIAQTHIQGELVAEEAPKPGETFYLALHFKPEAGWHGYWSNPGDAGYGMELDWELPDGWSAGEPEYPVPQRLLISGLMNHVYEGDYAVLVPIEVPADYVPSGSSTVAVDAEWLACTDEVCVPERGRFLARFPASGNDARFDAWRAALPPLLDSEAQFALTDELLQVAIPVPASLELRDPHVFVANTQLVDYAAPQTFYRKGDLLVAEIALKGVERDTGQVSGILKLDDAGNGVIFAGVPGEVPVGGTRVGGSSTSLAPLWLLLGGALLGGLLLNIMPCVFPILSLKAMTLARAGESEAEARREGAAYTAGVILACLALGGVLLALRAGGSEIGWAFQLQEPGVVVALLVLAVAITANFAGMFELPSLSFTRKGGRQSAFATGLLAAFVATPCTGPFMATAMGAALLLPWWQALLLFATLGLGLALPFLLLGYVPAFRKILPKPGAWMETFRKILAIPMGLTALALLWLAWRLGGTLFAAAALLLAIAVIAAFVVWHRGARTPAFALLATAIAASLFLPQAYQPPADRSDEGILAAQSFSEAALAEARASGTPVFLWFTADWCVTCKVNENVAIEREATKAAFEKAGVVAMRGDWTRRDPEITRFLTAHGVAGVPLYLWYAPDGSEEQLPQVLGPDSLVVRAEAIR